MYVLRLNGDQGMIGANPLEVSIEFDDQERELRVTDVSGVVNDDRGEQRDAVLDDVILQEKTLYENEYYLDHARFGIMS